MSSPFNELQSTVPLLMILHGLCEFHRRKANASQKRLHQRQREARLKRKLGEAEAEAVESRLTKKVCPSMQDTFDPTTIDPIPHEAPFIRATACTVGTHAEQLVNPNFMMELSMPLPFTAFSPLETTQWTPSNLQPAQDEAGSAIV
ncbi:hypothetical protein PHYSODRAFT_256192 [Phytophthora sojae]|uniref:Uncharacterized protein n=1 Tax=Phytophthora sojae (strain P6497) TaxID=1094619 RepID=G4ZSI0_PHYSP|nr:hypothetical protein PHYSODRAFT_256192 [Phytophthora sojae]EGZ14060.1 hypothetical protein PHYSODRAFT_256192 [Phytophthora sojae]|eukprot:XP_009531489.1 hypothetical protein PHYSODRAFT_256192 [Phytophthora sojae]